MHIHSTAYKRQNSFNLQSTHPILRNNDRIIVKATDEEIVLKVASFSYVGMTYTPCTTHGEWRGISVSNAKIKAGRYEFDEELSNEDEAIFYYAENV